MRRNRAGYGFVGWVWCTALLILLASEEAKGQTKKVRVAQPSNAVSQIALQAAKAKGFYQEEGLDVELIMMRGPVANVSLIAGEVQFTTVPTAGLGAAIRGAPIRILFTTYHRPMWSLYVKRGISEVRGLKGKIVGVGGIASATGSLAIEILNRHGLKPGRDVALVAIGGQAILMTALRGGSVDAALFTNPWTLRAERMGFQELVSLTKEGFSFFSGSIVTREPVLRSDPAMVEKFVRATLKGFRYARENRSGAISVMIRNMGTSKDLAAKSYDQALQAMTQDGTTSKEDQKKYLELVANIRGVKKPPPFEKFFDFSLARKVNAELKAKGWKPGP